MSENHYYAYAYTGLNGEVQTTDHLLRLPVNGDADWIKQAVYEMHTHVHVDGHGETNAPGVIVPVLVVERGA